MSIVCTELGQECSNEGKCILRNNNVDDVQCTDGICQCVDGLRPSVQNNQCNSGLLNAVYQEYFQFGLFYRRDQHCRCHLHGYCHCCRYTVLRNKMSNMHTLLIEWSLCFSTTYLTKNHLMIMKTNLCVRILRNLTRFYLTTYLTTNERQHDVISVLYYICIFTHAFLASANTLLLLWS